MVIPMRTEPDLYYRHAKQENLFLVGPEQHRYKNSWIRQQIKLFQSLGWRFVTLDLSCEMGRPDLIGEEWSSIERRAMQNLMNPIIRIPTLSQLIDTLDQVAFSMEQSQTPFVVVIHMGNKLLEADTLKCVEERIRRLISYRTGVWLIAPSLETFSFSLIKRYFQTHILLSQFGVDEEVFRKWNKAMEIDPVEEDLDDTEALFVFNGRSEGAGGQVFRGSITGMGGVH